MKIRFEFKKREFSKMIFIFVSAIVIALTVFTCIIVWRTEDLAPLTYLIPAAFAEFATTTGFYYNKAKMENKLKIMAEQGIKLNENNIDKIDL